MVRRAVKVLGIFLVTITFLIVWNAIVAPALNAPHEQKIAICDQKAKILDQAAIALDHNDQAKYDELQLQADSIKGC